MGQLTKRQAIIIFCAIAGIILASYTIGRLMAVASGFPDLANFSAAEVYVYDESNFEEQCEPLSAEEQKGLKEALSAIRPIGLATDANSLPAQTGWPGEMFHLTLNDGSIITVKDAYQHILVGYISPPGRTRAWYTSDSSLALLGELYEKILTSHLDEP